MVHKPGWFRDDEVFVSYAPTSGINKDGADLFRIDPESGQRTDVIDDQLNDDVVNLLADSAETDTSRWVASAAMTSRLMAVPVYFDGRPREAFLRSLERPEFAGFKARTIGSLIDDGYLEVRVGHGSPSADLRNGSVPYIKVSDVRAGQVNINPSNRVPEVIARRFWKGEDSGLRPFDLLTPMRSSKNIGEFALLMPGQEEVVLTKEILVLRPTSSAPFDQFYLFWALTLRLVREQWQSVVFMQTNREDVGNRYREILLPVPPNLNEANARSEPFRDFYLGTQKLRSNFVDYLATDDLHHVFLGTGSNFVESEDVSADD